MPDFDAITEIIGREFRYQAILYLFALIGYVWLNLMLSEFAGKRYGGQIGWFFCLMLIPVISHIVLLFLVLCEIKFAGSRKVLSDVADDPGPGVSWIDETIFKDGVDSSITPFGRSETGAIPDSMLGSTGILNRRRDRKLDELIEFEQWGHAKEYAENRLNKARERKNADAIELYSAYLELLSYRTPKFWGPKIRD